MDQTRAEEENTFSQNIPAIMHVDINSCFATVEQQANPRLRGVPTVVAAYVKDYGCILAASKEAKRLGIQTGMRVKEAKSRCPFVEVRAPDPDKYRFVNHALRTLLEHYTPDVSVESIDEMVLSLDQTPALFSRMSGGVSTETAMNSLAVEIKHRVREQIGEWMTVSIGIAPNRYLAKVASGLHKPDGLDSITRGSVAQILASLQLEDLCGIKRGNATRLRQHGIYTPLALYQADADTLQRAFHSIVGRQWWLRLHGYEDGVRYMSFGRSEHSSSSSVPSRQKSFGHSHALGKPLLPKDPMVLQILSQLTKKMGMRLRQAGYTARGVGVSISYDSYADHWHAVTTTYAPIFADGDFFTRFRDLLARAPSQKLIRILAVYCYHLVPDLYGQQTLFEEDRKKEHLTQAIDAITAKWGFSAIASGRMLDVKETVQDRISFGRVRDLARNT